MKKLILCVVIIATQLILPAQNVPGIPEMLNAEVPDCERVSKNAIRLIAIEKVQHSDSLNVILTEWKRACIRSEQYLRVSILLGLREHINIDQHLSDYEKHCLYHHQPQYTYTDKIYSDILDEFTTALADSLAAVQKPQSCEQLWCLYFGSDLFKFNSESSKEYHKGHALYSKPYQNSGRNYNNNFGIKFNPGVGVCIPHGPIAGTVGVNTAARIGLDLYNVERGRGAELRFGAKITGNQTGVTSEIVDSVRGNIEAIYSIGINGYKDLNAGKNLIIRGGMMAGIDVLETDFKVENDTTSLKITTAMLTPSIALWTNRINKSNYGVEISYAPSLFFLNDKLNNDLRGGFIEIVFRFKFHVFENY